MFSTFLINIFLIACQLLESYKAILASKCWFILICLIVLTDLGSCLIEINYHWIVSSSMVALVHITISIYRHGWDCVGKPHRKKKKKTWSYQLFWTLHEDDVSFTQITTHASPLNLCSCGLIARQLSLLPMLPLFISLYFSLSLSLSGISRLNGLLWFYVAVRQVTNRFCSFNIKIWFVF